MTGMEDITERARAQGLNVLGGFAPVPADDLPPGTQSVVLLGPDGAAFWRHFNTAPEAQDGAPDPIDRWSSRVIGALAADLGGQALFPFGGPPYRPFYSWALRTGRCWRSPVSLLVHDVAGLMVSFRGALALPQALEARTGTSPCDSCATRPCLTACPVGALGPDGYDTKACHAFLDRPDGEICMTQGCRVRRACPAGSDFEQPFALSQLHMKSFHPA